MSDLKLLSVTARNFMSIGNIPQTIDFLRDGITLVLGRNLDTEMQGENAARNGAGKSTLVIHAVAYGLYGKVPDKITVGKLINNTNQKNMEVIITFQKGDTVFRIERGRKPTFLRLFINNKQAGEDTTVDETQGETGRTQLALEEIIGMSFNLFCYIIAMLSSTEPFFWMTAQKQRDFIEELFGITLLSQKADALREQINGNIQKGLLGTKGEIRDAEFRLKTQREMNQQIERTIEETKGKFDQWAVEQTNRITEAENGLEVFRDIDFAAESAAFDALDFYGVKEKEIEEFATSVSIQQSKMSADYIGKMSEANGLEKQAELIRQQKKNIQQETAPIWREIKDPDKEVALLLTQRINPDQEVALIHAGRKDPSVEIALILAGRKDADREITLLAARKKDPEEIATQILRGLVEFDEEKPRARLQQEIARYRDKMVILETEINHLETHDLADIQTVLDNPNSLTCSACGQSLEGTDHRDHMVENIEAERQKILQKIARLNGEITRHQETIGEMESEIQQLAEKKTEAEQKNSLVEQRAIAALEEAEKFNSDLADQMERLLGDIEEFNTSLGQKAEKKRLEIERFNQDIETQAITKLKEIQELNTSLESQVETVRATTLKFNQEVEARVTVRQTETEWYNQDIEQQALNVMEQAGAIRDAADVMREETDRTLSQALDQIEIDRMELGKRPVVMFDTRDDLWGAKSVADQLRSDLEALRKTPNPYGEQLDAYGRQIILLDYTEINRLTRLKDHQDFLLKFLTDKASVLRKRLVDQNLPFLNSRLKYHLGRNGLPHDVRIHNDLTGDITRFGRPLDYGNLSKGEKNRLKLSLSFAARDTYEKMRNRVNVMLVDEAVDDGMDDLGVELVFESLRSMAREQKRNIFLISHKEQILAPRCQTILMARKENEFTTYGYV